MVKHIIETLLSQQQSPYYNTSIIKNLREECGEDDRVRNILNSREDACLGFGIFLFGNFVLTIEFQ
jgi:hypothetical protein